MVRHLCFNYAAAALLAQPLLPQDSNINLWWTDNGVRAGSFDGHNGVVWTCDITCEPLAGVSAWC